MNEPGKLKVGTVVYVRAIVRSNEDSDIFPLYGVSPIDKDKQDNGYFYVDREHIVTVGDMRKAAKG